VGLGSSPPRRGSSCEKFDRTPSVPPDGTSFNFNATAQSGDRWNFHLAISVPLYLFQPWMTPAFAASVKYRFPYSITILTTVAKLKIEKTSALSGPPLADRSANLPFPRSSSSTTISLSLKLQVKYRGPLFSSLPVFLTSGNAPADSPCASPGVQPICCFPPSRSPLDQGKTPPANSLFHPYDPSLFSSLTSTGARSALSTFFFSIQDPIVSFLNYAFSDPQVAPSAHKPPPLMGDSLFWRGGFPFCGFPPLSDPPPTIPLPCRAPRQGNIKDR